MRFAKSISANIITLLTYKKMGGQRQAGQIGSKNFGLINEQIGDRQFIKAKRSDSGDDTGYGERCCKRQAHRGLRN